MYKIRFALRVITLLTFVCAFAAVASAQATRTWVSGVGDDVNPCSRTAPCKTWAGAISKTATGGEIDALDPGGYGTLTITKAITVDGTTGAGWGSTLFSSVNGFVINITTNLATDQVILRNLSINGAGTTLGVDGIRFIDGASLTVENVEIFNFSGDGIEVIQSQACNLYVRNVDITRGGNGIKTASSSGAVNGTLENVTISGMSGVGGHGIQAVSNTTLTMKNVTVARNSGDGIRSEAATVNLIVQDTNVHGNNVGVNAIAGAVRINNVGMFFNNTNLSSSVLTSGANRSAGNTVTNNPTPGGFTIH
jgi:hypothetical protein